MSAFNRMPARDWAELCRRSEEVSRVALAWREHVKKKAQIALSPKLGVGPDNPGGGSIRSVEAALSR